jgi:hypothetical protein
MQINKREVAKILPSQDTILLWSKIMLIYKNKESDMKKFVLYLMVVACIIMPACTPTPQNTVIGSGIIATETRQPGSFHGINLSIPGEMQVQLGEKESITIEAEDNILPLIQTIVSGGILRVDTPSGQNIQPTKPIKYLVTVINVDQLTTESLGSITTPALVSDTFTATINSTGFIDVAGLQAKSLDVKIESTGNINIGPGEIDKQTIVISSTGNFAAPDLKSNSAKVTIDSSGDVLIWVTDILNATINSSGSIKYYGNPKVTSEKNSSGTLVSLGAK